MHLNYVMGSEPLFVWQRLWHGNDSGPGRAKQINVKSKLRGIDFFAVDINDSRKLPTLDYLYVTVEKKLIDLTAPILRRSSPLCHQIF